MVQKLYTIGNVNLKELYFGMTQGRVRDCVRDLRAQADPRFANWDWEKHHIECEVIAKVEFAPLAPLRLRSLKSEYKRTNPGWKIL